ncbi:hypothetical protein QA648_27580 (plasmid) [Rhizobium sp. CB3171]|uniref:hypothetical protein n=1 Tax=Rhizobium sp. CB3171 TaxID=3039157 RepID=UPI0024B15DDF|nr:hypothetical protein [Rhizobium sp. CB3171]WFU04544.1 hypothetical protein QA648_27580 [Rhizobium sp. CB3171]
MDVAGSHAAEQNRLRRIAIFYQKVRDTSRVAGGERVVATLRSLRRARRRLKRIGFRLKEAEDGSVTVRRRKLRKKGDIAATTVVAAMEAFILRNQLVYGDGRRGRASWSLPLNTLALDEDSARYVESALPSVIAEFAQFCRGVIRDCLDGKPASIPLLRGVPADVRDLWRRELSNTAGTPFCFRPDLVVTSSGDVKIVEFNVDSRLDRGVAEGVSRYSRSLIGSQRRLLGGKLVESYTDAARTIVGESAPIFGATVTGTSWRREYFSEETFFCNELSRQAGLKWVVRHLEELEVDARTGTVRDRATGMEFDILRIDFDLLGSFGEGRAQEVDFANAIMKPTATPYVGSMLPFADKLLLAAATTSDRTSPTLKAALCPTSLFSPTQYEPMLRAQAEGQHFVLKKCGLFAETTGSKAVVISSDVGASAWREAVDQMLRDWREESALWVIQPRLQPKRFEVAYRRRVNSITKRADCFVRLSPFYTQRMEPGDDVCFQLAGAVATAGTDPETLNSGHFTIRGLRESTYLAVTAPKVKFHPEESLELMADVVGPPIAAEHFLSSIPCDQSA